MSATEVASRTAEPYASICYVQVTYPDGTAARASGVIVGVNDVLTALHVVYEPAHGGWATAIDVVPGADTTPWNAPFGSFTSFGSIVGLASNWDLNGDGLLSQSESAGDLALIGMNTRIGDFAGIVPVAKSDVGFTGVVAGYPASGTGLMADSVTANPSSSASVYTIGESLGAGASGGPLLETIDGVSRVVGILSAGASDGSSSTYCGLFSDATWAWLQNAINANDTLVASVGASAPLPGGMSFIGTASADNWTGSTGPDRFTGNGGDDVFDGGLGTDTAIFIGQRSQYSVVHSGATLIVSDSVPSRDGSDTLSNVERVQFSDVSVAFDTQGTAGEAYRLYQAAFDRAPDVPGLGYQMSAMDHGLTLAQVAGNFLNSPEFGATYGALDDTSYVTQLYANVLHRQPDDQGLLDHLQDMHDRGYSRADVLVNFSESPENQAALAGVMQAGMLFTT